MQNRDAQVDSLRSQVERAEKEKQSQVDALQTFISKAKQSFEQ